MKRKGNYTLYDITASPLTSHVYAPGGPEADMAERVPNTLVSEQSFARITIAGEKGKCRMEVSFRGIKGVEKAKWSVDEDALKSK